MKHGLTAARLRELLHYEPGTGVFRWFVSPGNQIKSGGIAGSPNDKGYLQIRIDGIKHRAHRLAWLYITGANAPSEIDHINGSKSYNSWRNLRLSNRSLNLQNQRKAMRNNFTGFLGVTKRRERVFVARIRLDGKSTFLGQFATPELAHAAYIEAKRQLHRGGTL